ncbi:hypothetical protein F5X96DRAFT_476410 [Biscogniauxia mediterranea]|nr:hypothetical protein F5X96DRAFT_476410 [Biscogniauxia mediterranea]
MDPSSPTATTSPPPPPPRPLILIVSHTLTGHLAPMLRISSALCARGWTVYFLGPRAQGARISRTGATFVALQGRADLSDEAYYAAPPVPGYAALPWHERVLVDLREQVLEPLPDAWASVRAALRFMRAEEEQKEKKPPRDVLVLAEAFFYGILPLRYGAPVYDDEEEGERRPRSLCVSVTVPAVRCAELPPLGYGGLLASGGKGGESGESGSAREKERSERLWRAWARKAAPLTELLARKLREAGATRGLDPDHVFLSGENYVCHERILQLGVPGFEYPRASWPAGFRFVGLVQGGGSRSRSRMDERKKKRGERKDGDDDDIEKEKEKEKGTGKENTPDFPWWPDVLANSASLRADDPGRKKIVVVAQGTVETNPHDLIIPTIRAFADPASVSRYIVVAILGWKSARLTSLSASSTIITTDHHPSSPPPSHPASTTPTADAIPPNAYIAPYLSYDAVLPHADAWVHNGGFGAVSHGIVHGVPMVVAGEGMDKGENAARVAWSGIGVDLRCGARASAAAVREGVEYVLRDEEEEEEKEEEREEGNQGGRRRRRRGTPRQRIQELRKENEAMDCFRIVEEELWSVARTPNPEVMMN